MLKFFHTIIMFLSFNGEKGYLYRCVNILFLTCGIFRIHIIQWILSPACRYSLPFCCKCLLSQGACSQPNHYSNGH